MSSAHGSDAASRTDPRGCDGTSLAVATVMNNEEQALADEADETAARERTTDAYDSLDIDDEEEIELGDDDILFETDERD